MSALKFAETHNLVAFLEKPTESEGFEEIVDFLNANPIKYALTVNPTIHSSCIKQFWDTVKAKMVNGEVQLQALVDKKKVIITESIIRRDLQLEDANGVDCLPNATIFEELTRMRIFQCLSAKTTAWNEFNSTIASYGKILDVSKKEMGEGLANPTDPHHTPIITQPSTSQPQKKHKPRKSKRKDTEIPQSSGPTEPIAVEAANEENVPTHSNDPLLSGEDSLKLNELMELCNTLQKKVLDLETSKTTQALEIESLKRRMKKLKKKQRSRNHKLRRLYKVGLSAKVVSSDDEASLGDQEDASKQRRKILDINVDEDITLDSTHFDTNPDMFGVHDLYGDELFVETKEPVVNAAITTTTTAITTVADEVEMTLAQTLIEIKNAKPKAKGIVMLQQEEQEELTIEEKSKLFQQLLKKRRKFFTAKRAEEKRNRPPTKAQQRSIISKRAGDELEQEKAKKQKIDDDQEEAKMKELMKVVSDEEGVAIDAIPLSC
ncbi:hypothetical protein Tco_0886371 [Tanacetum coccineum]